MNIEQAIKEYLEQIKRNYLSRYGLENYPADRLEFIKTMQQEWIDSVKYKVCAKYIKVTTGTSVHSFIVTEDGIKFKAGDILKAAGWNAPAKNFARGNVFAPSTYELVSWTGA